MNNTKPDKPKRMVKDNLAIEKAQDWPENQERHGDSGLNSQ